MRKCVSVLWLLLAVPGFSAQSPEQPPQEVDRILTLESAWNAAEQQKDAAALQMLLAQELAYVDYDGRLMDKTEYLAQVTMPSLHPERIVDESRSVRIFGVTAVVTGVFRESGVKNGKPYAARARFTDTWVRRGGSWLCVASQSTLIVRSHAP
jgi:ketosteroid isomerase-like protein